MVSSTETRSVHGDYRANLIERELNSLIGKKTKSLGGVFHRSTGDGGICVFDSVGAALDTARELHDGCSHLAVEQGTDVALRIGISAGEVVRESDDAPLQGFVFLESARLCAEADPGSSIASAAVLGLIRFTADGFQFGPEKSLSCRGITELVPAHTVELQPTAPAGRSDIMASERRVAMVGRAPRLREIQNFLQTESEKPETRLVTVVGHPGIGKSRMLAELAMTLPRINLAIGHATCKQRDEPFAPFLRALDQLLPPNPAHVSSDAEKIDGKGLDQASDQRIRFQQFGNIMGETAIDSVIMLDDLHWTDNSTIDLLEYLLGTHGVKRTFFVAIRSGYEDRVLRLESAADASLRVDLEPISMDATRSLVRSLLPPAIGGEEVVARIAKRCEGNPLMAWLLATHEADGLTLGRTDQTQAKPIEAMVTARLAEMNDVARKVLTFAATTQELDQELLATATEVPSDDVRRIIETDGVRSGLLRTDEGGASGFVHHMVTSAISESVSDDARVAMHDRMAEVMTTRGKISFIHIADHLIGAKGKAKPAEIVQACAAAAGEAIETGAYSAAADWYEEASHHATDEESDLGFKVQAVQCQIIAGRPDSRHQAKQRAAEALAAGLPSLAAQALLATDRGFFSSVGTTDTDFVSLAGQTLNLLPTPSPEAAHLQALVAAELIFSNEDGVAGNRGALSDQAIAEAEQLGDDAVLCRVLALGGMSRRGMANIPERRRMCERLVALAEVQNDPWLHYISHLQLGAAALEDCDIALADECVDLAEAAAADLRQPRAVWSAGLMRTAQLIHVGQLSDADDSRRSARAAGRRAGFSLEAYVMSIEQDLEIARWRNVLPERVADLRSWAGDPSLDLTLAGLNYLSLAGEDDEAANRLDALLAAETPTPDHAILEGPRLINLGQVALRCGNRETASGVYERLRHVPNTWFQSTVSLGCTAHHAATIAVLLGKEQDAINLFEQALSIHDRARSPLWWSETVLKAIDSGLPIEGLALTDGREAVAILAAASRN